MMMMMMLLPSLLVLLNGDGYRGGRTGKRPATAGNTPGPTFMMKVFQFYTKSVNLHEILHEIIRLWCQVHGD